MTKNILRYDVFHMGQAIASFSNLSPAVALVKRYRGISVVAVYMDGSFVTIY